MARSTPTTRSRASLVACILALWIGTTLRADEPVAEPKPIGDAWNDPRNPVYQTWNGERLDLWSLKKPKRGIVPPPVEAFPASWKEKPIDRFVAAKLAERELSPTAEADRPTLIRRLTFDVTGLPPTKAEVDAFVADIAPDAYEKLVDRLLASPRFGEHQARWWLDVVRYADTNGFEWDEFRPEMYRYRDYVIRSFNADKPYDVFLKEQLAGDESQRSPPQNVEEADRLIATGFLRLGPWDNTGKIFQEEAKNRNELLTDLTNTTGSAFLGLTMSCCNCHDHKYDPLLQTDYFRLRAFFAGVQFKDDLVIEKPDEAAAIAQHNEGVDAQLKEIGSKITELLKPAREKLVAERREALPEEIKAIFAIAKEKRTEEQKQTLKPHQKTLKVTDDEAAAASGEEVQKQHSELTSQRSATEATKRKAQVAWGMIDESADPPATHVFEQGDFTEPGEQVEPGFFSYLWPENANIDRPQDQPTSGRRTTLAKWIASDRNPFAARVIVNRLWHHYFGRGIVATTNDFGYSGERPTHPELLDWLACELVTPSDESSVPWSLKRLHKAILMSAVYRQSSIPSSDEAATKSLANDPDARWLSRHRVRRLSAETMRDALLATSGSLLPYEAGAAKWPPIPEEILMGEPSIYEARTEGGTHVPQDYFGQPEEETWVRSIFLVQKRCMSLPMLRPFDLPDNNVSCARRDSTTVAPQALTLLNSEFTRLMTHQAAERVMPTAPAPGEETRYQQVAETAFKMILSRSPNREESELAANLLQRHAAEHQLRIEGEDKEEASLRAAVIDLCRILFNTNEFVYVD
jgi:hypothetical protein